MTFLDYCEKNLDFSINAPSGYNSAPLCALDSVFSTGVKYASVINVVNRFSEFIKEPYKTTEISTSEVLCLIGNRSGEDLAEILNNRQRTSTRGNSILKAEAYIRFLRVMKEYKVEKCGDIKDMIENQEFQGRIKSIPGQRSGLTLDYLFILAGVENYVKVDRHITRFAIEATGEHNLTKDRIIQLVRETADEMSKQNHPGMNARWLDHIIWSYQAVNTSNG